MDHYTRTEILDHANTFVMTTMVAPFRATGATYTNANTRGIQMATYILARTCYIRADIKGVFG